MLIPPHAETIFWTAPIYLCFVEPVSTGVQVDRGCGVGPCHVRPVLGREQRQPRDAVAQMESNRNRQKKVWIYVPPIQHGQAR